MVEQVVARDMVLATVVTGISVFVVVVMVVAVALSLLLLVLIEFGVVPVAAEVVVVEVLVVLESMRCPAPHPASVLNHNPHGPHALPSWVPAECSLQSLFLW